MKIRNWSIRSKIIAMVTVPLVALLALWIFVTTLSAGPARTLLSARTLADGVATRGATVGAELQQERRLTLQFLAYRDATTDELNHQRRSTDEAVAAFRAAARDGDAWAAAGAVLRSRIDQVITELTTMSAQRIHIDRREIDLVGAQNIYNGTLSALFAMFNATASFPDEEINRQIRGLTALRRGEEYLSRVDSLLAGATTKNQFTDDLRAAAVQDIGTARALLEQGVEDMPEAHRAAYDKLSSGPAFNELNALMDRLIRQSRPGSLAPVDADFWHETYLKVELQLAAFENDMIAAIADRGSKVAVAILTQLVVAALLGLVAVAVSLAISYRVGRSMAVRLGRLRSEAQEMAAERLPNVVRRLQRGEKVDVSVETPPLAYGNDEIGELGRAFDEVQRTAVQSAVEEANVRRGLNEVFLNIARRSQTLLHRQLALLDRMERRENEPQALEDLYRVDHLATRMRRHAEDLVILAGATPGRGWRNPVPAIDVVRGAIGEVDDYKRIDVHIVASMSILGRAVGDVIHLLAELLENAASYSPPQTRVLVTGQVLPNGYAIEIEDRGLGMSHDDLDRANRRLVEPPDFDPADSARLGLFVVAQLANRHGIRVSLRESAFGGITAVVLLPGELVASDPGRSGLPSGAAPNGARPLVGSGLPGSSRRSIAALQWQDREEARHLTVPGRPDRANDDPKPEPAAAPTGGPVPASVADGLTADGLVQRRRVSRPVDLGTADAARTADDGLPRRVRQASLAPALRQLAAPLIDDPTLPLRSPEQVRSMMSSLQLGTARGRLDASRYVESSTIDALATLTRSEDPPTPEKDAH